MSVTLAIYATRHLSCAHLNPAVSIAMVAGNRMSIARLPVYLFAQFVGAFTAAAVLYFLFSGSIAQFEDIHGIIRGTAASRETAMMFGEFYPNPGAGIAASVSMTVAFAAEMIGTFAMLNGWGRAALPDDHFGILIAYVLGPIAGGLLAGFFFNVVVQPLMSITTNKDCNCQ